MGIGGTIRLIAKTTINYQLSNKTPKVPKVDKKLYFPAERGFVYDWAEKWFELSLLIIEVTKTQIVQSFVSQVFVSLTASYRSMPSMNNDLSPNIVFSRRCLIFHLFESTLRDSLVPAKDRAY